MQQNNQIGNRKERRKGREDHNRGCGGSMSIPEWNLHPLIHIISNIHISIRCTTLLLSTFFNLDVLFSDSSRRIVIVIASCGCVDSGCSCRLQATEGVVGDPGEVEFANVGYITGFIEELSTYQLGCYGVLGEVIDLPFQPDTAP
jgi:hypothetical protein